MLPFYFLKTTRERASTQRSSCAARRRRSLMPRGCEMSVLGDSESPRAALMPWVSLHSRQEAGTSSRPRGSRRPRGPQADAHRNLHLQFVLHPVHHGPLVAARGHRLPAQDLLGVVQADLRVLRGRQLGRRVWRGTQIQRSGGRVGERREVEETNQSQR